MQKGELSSKRQRANDKRAAWSVRRIMALVKRPFADVEWLAGRRLSAPFFLLFDFGVCLCVSTF
jgi:hypothetical protein